VKKEGSPGPQGENGRERREASEAVFEKRIRTLASDEKGGDKVPKEKKTTTAKKWGSHLRLGPGDVG